MSFDWFIELLHCLCLLGFLVYSFYFYYYYFFYRDKFGSISVVKQNQRNSFGFIFRLPTENLMSLYTSAAWIDLFDDTAAILNTVISNSYNGMIKGGGGQISMYRAPGVYLYSFLKKRIKHGRRIAEIWGPYVPYLQCSHSLLNHSNTLNH